MLEECRNKEQNEVFEEEMLTASDTEDLDSSNDGITYFYFIKIIFWSHQLALITMMLFF